MTRIIYSKPKFKKISTLAFTLILLFTQFEINAQSNKKAEDLLESAKQQVSAKNYPQAIKTCNEILASEPGFKDAHLLLADVYNVLDSTDLEIIHLNKAGEIGREWDVVFKLGETYFKKGNYSEALRYYNIYSDYQYVSEKRQFLLACKMASCKFSLFSIGNPDVKPDSKNMGGTGLNTDEFWPVPSADGKNLVFKRILKDKNSNTVDENYSSIPDSQIWNITKLVSDSVTFDNEGTQKLNGGTKILFFTACNKPDGAGDCDIYMAKFENGKWGLPINAGISLNSDKWDGQSTFFAKNKTLYFSSDRNGGNGKKDLWKSELLGFAEDGTAKWKEPVNLGNLINTPGNEISPLFYENKQILYFASDGHPGLGGMDIFSCEIAGSGQIVNLRNLGYPVNTGFDDDAISLNHISDTTYFASSRQTAKGQEIYAFNLDRGIPQSKVAYVKARVKDMSTMKPLVVNLKLESQPFKSGRPVEQETGENGESMFCLQLNRNYAFTVSEPGYLFYSSFMNQGNANSVMEPYTLDINLQPIEIGAEVQLYSIYFDTDSFRILPQSGAELQNLVTFLKNNGDLKVEVQGHTDSSGNAEKNKILSERRAKSVVDYLTENGINISRLKYSGYGDKNPIATNETAEGRMLNRRTTIKILEK